MSCGVSGLVAEDLLHPRMRDARGSSNGPLGMLRHGLTDGGAPLLLGAGAAHGGQLDAGEAVGHLPGGFDRSLKGGDGLGSARVVKAGRDAESLGFGAEAVVRLCLTDEFAVGHTARIVARGAGVKSR